MMSASRLGALLSVLGLATGATRSAMAQGANTTVMANVLQGIVVTPAQSLDFGAVFPGVNKTIAAAPGGNQGSFQVTGQANQNITLTFTLPANLVSGANLLPVGSWTGWHNNNPFAGPGVNFAPLSVQTTQLSTLGQRFVYLGGTVSPAPNQPAGFYSAVATLTVAYF